MLLVSVFSFPLTDENHLLVFKLFSSLLDQLLVHCTIMVHSRSYYWKRKFATWGLLSNLENSTKMYFTWRLHSTNVAQALGEKKNMPVASIHILSAGLSRRREDYMEGADYMAGIDVK